MNKKYLKKIANFGKGPDLDLHKMPTQEEK
jgi:hypothetical protein